MNIIEQWSTSKLFCESVIENPDDSKNEKMEIKGDEYEKLLADKEKIEKETKDKVSNKQPKDVEEALTADEILKKHEEQKNNSEDTSKGKVSNDPITEIDINEMYDGYVNATVKRGEKGQVVELEIPEDDISEMLQKLLAKASERNKTPSEDDACAALVYLMVQKNASESDAIKWLFGKSKKKVSDWEFFDDLDASMIEGVDDRGFSSVWNTGVNNDVYNKLDITSHDED